MVCWSADTRLLLVSLTAHPSSTYPTMPCHACRDHILPEDFLLFFDGDEDSAHDAFAYFDRNGDGSISCTELQVGMMRFWLDVVAASR